MIYDCIIAGSGPSGSLCAYIMQKIGLKCLIMEKLHEHGEKVNPTRGEIRSLLASMPRIKASTRPPQFPCRR